MKKATTILMGVSLVAAALLASPSQAAFPDLTKIYRFTGIVNNVWGGTSGNCPCDVTLIQCTNWKQSSAQIQIIIYDGDTGETLTGPVYTIDHQRTVTVITKKIVERAPPLFPADHDLSMDTRLMDGSMEIRATTPQVHCDVKRIYAYDVYPGPNTTIWIRAVAFTSLHGVRYSQEGGGGSIQE